MPHSFLETNLAALRYHTPVLVEWIAPHLDSVEKMKARIIINRWGVLDWGLPSGKGLFDAIPPQQFYKDWRPADKSEIGATIIVGANLGYGLNHVLESTPNSHKVIVLEPRIEMLLACLDQTDYTPFIKINKLRFVPADRELFRRVVFAELRLQYAFGQIALRVDMPSRQLGPEYAAWKDTCGDILTDLSVEMDTFRASHATMIQNELDNFRQALQDGSLSHLRNQAKGVAGVVIGSGPSLDRFGPLMAENSGKAIYAAAFQSLPSLQRYGLTPHFCLAIDFTTTLMRVYEGLDPEWLKRIPLIYSCKISPDVLQRYPGPTLPLWTIGGLGQLLWNGGELILNTGRNVGIALTRFLLWCGVSKLLFAGQDFAWSGDRTHASGHLAAKREFRFNPERHIEMTNAHGAPIYSTSVYMTALQTLEDVVHTSEVPAYNLYGGLAVIKGASNVTWSQACNQGVLNAEPGILNHFLGQLTQIKTPLPPPRSDTQGSGWAASLRSVQRKLDKLSPKAHRRQSEIRQTLMEILGAMNKNPLYRTYLSEEIHHLAGLVYAKSRYGLGEVADCRKTIKSALKKANEMDRKLELLIPNRTVFKQFLQKSVSAGRKSDIASPTCP